MKTKITFLMVATLMLAMFAIGCDDGSSDDGTSGGSGTATVPSTKVLAYMDAIEWDVDANDYGIEPGDLVGVGITGVKSYRYGDAYKATLIADNGGAAAVDILFNDATRKTDGYKGWDELIVKLQAAVTKTNLTPLNTLTSDERNNLSYMASELGDSVAMSTNDCDDFMEELANVGVVGIPSAFKNYDTQAPLYKTGLLASDSGAAILALLDTAKITAATDTEFVAAVTALNTIIAAVNTANPPVAAVVVAP